MSDAPELPPPPTLEALLATGPHALFLDFDGTLVDIAPTPDGILVPDRLGERLVALSEKLDGRLAVVSGRALDNLEKHCGPLSVACAGSHGAARRAADGTMLGEAALPLPAEAIAEVAGFAAATGVRHETKAHGTALHSRETPEREEACAMFMDEVAERHGLAVKRGKRVSELVRPGADKGGAVRALMAEAPFAGAVPVFVGDDVTDEDGFAACVALGGFAIAVGPRPTKNARFGVADPAAVQHWLEL
ncbi:trehalose-phosphatase [Altererythrobacter salegens]|uniref:Trehalose 6-phosphate phosphatase n=1 Tax=Croceibacterium salegens TaxID=1737568 RepID=A0A6I4SZI7_9SPHN|nr:trehalose-phosphatase [Croceibacterium salegens]MXO61273.1 trehalose-phosphatase [Croceibacterium salegens]